MSRPRSGRTHCYEPRHKTDSPETSCKGGYHFWWFHYKIEVKGNMVIFEPHHEKTNNGVSNQVRHKPSVCRKWLEAGNFGLRKERNCTIPLAKTKSLISFAVTAKLICVFVFAYAICWFSHEVAHLSFKNNYLNTTWLEKIITAT